MTGGITEDEVRAHRLRLGVGPVFKRIDSCAAEFDAATPYLYSTYEAPLFGEPEDEAEVSDRRKVMILGGGPNRIGQGIEFDYCCCHAAFALGRDRNGQTGAGFEDDHGQLQSGDGLDRPGHLGPALFRAADGRGRARDRAARAGEGRAARRDRPARRPDAAQARGGAAGGGRADPRHLARQHRPCRGPRAVRGAGPAARASSSRPTASRAAATRRCGWRSGSAIRCSCGPPTCSAGAGMEVVDGPQQLDHYIATAVQVSGKSPVLIDRYLARRDRGRRRRDLRRDATSRSAACSSISRKRACIRATAPARSRRYSLAAEHRRRDRAADARAGAGAQGPRADERPVRGQGRRGLSDRGQSAREPHRAVRRQGDRAGRSQRWRRG